MALAVKALGIPALLPAPHPGQGHALPSPALSPGMAGLLQGLYSEAVNGNISNSSNPNCLASVCPSLLLLGVSRRCCRVSVPFSAKAHLSLAASCSGSPRDSVPCETVRSESRDGVLSPQLLSSIVDGDM